MTIRLARPGDSAAWNALVATSGSFLQSWQWGEFRSTLGWRPIRLIAEEGGAPVGVMHVLHRRFRPTGGMLYVPRGPVAADPAVQHALLAALRPLAKDAGAWFARVEPALPGTPASASFCRDLGMRRAPTTVQLPHTAIVDLSPAPEQILAGFKPNWRRNVRSGERRGVTIREGTAADLATYYRLERETAARQGILGRPFAYYQEFLRQFQEAGVTLFLAEVAAEPVAAAITLEFGRTATYLYGASSRRHRGTHPNYLLQWTAMLHARRAGCTVYDLCGCGAPGDRTGHVAGLTEFKGGFGPIIAFTGAWDLPTAPIYPLWRRAELGRKAWLRVKAHRQSGKIEGKNGEHG
jgi:peptidoglycan pentaglycine glycine transferase (the first glycine)